MASNNRINKLFNRNDHQKWWRTSRRLLDLVESIPDPAYYLAGLPRPELHLPENIVIFHRHPDKLRHLPLSHNAQYVLIINHQGPGAIILNERRLRFRPGQAALIFPGQVHHYPNLKPPLTWLFISFKIHAPEALAVLQDAVTDLPPAAWNYVGQIVADYNRAGRAAPLVASRITFNLWLLLMELSNANPKHIAGKLLLEESARARALKLEQYVLAHIREPLHIPDLARQVNMSASGLRFFARKIMHRRLGRYIRHTRIACACELMNGTELTLTQIAERCGFGSLYAFSRAFKQVIGAAPSSYRARLKKSSRTARRRPTASRFHAAARPVIPSQPRQIAALITEYASA